MMPSPVRSRARRRSVIALLAGLGLLAAGCGPALSGAAVLPGRAVATGASATPAASGQITVPSGGGADAAPGTTAAAGTGTPSPTAGSGSAAPAPAGLAKFYGQQLSWGGCSTFSIDDSTAQSYADPSLQCARLTVPLAYAQPAGPTITIGVLRKAATDPGKRIGSLIIDPGGPGVSGMSNAADLAGLAATGGATGSAAVIATLNASFDLVGFDPRGVGSAVPAVTCQTDAQKDAARTVVARSRTPAEVDAANAVTKRLVAACVANTGKAQGIPGATFLANVGTRDVARDLDVLRAALGDVKLTYLGFSYGTQIGWVYAEQFPKNVRAILFDGVEAPDADQATANIDQAKAFQGAFVDFATWCGQNSPSCVLGTDPASATGVFQSLVRPLLDRPLALPDGRVLSFNDAITGVSQALYANALWSTLARGLLAFSHGDGRTLMALADLYDERDTQGHYTNTLEAFNAVRCVDAPPLTSPAAITKFNAAAAAASPYQTTGDPAGAVADICAYWPVPPTLTPHKLAITGLPRTLVISTTGDPATPYAAGVDLAQQINAALLTVKATNHTSFLQNLSCVDAIGSAYLTTLALPPAGATC